MSPAVEDPGPRWAAPQLLWRAASPWCEAAVSTGRSCTRSFPPPCTLSEVWNIHRHYQYLLSSAGSSGVTADVSVISVPRSAAPSPLWPAESQASLGVDGIKFDDFSASLRLYTSPAEKETTMKWQRLHTEKLSDDFWTNIEQRPDSAAPRPLWRAECPGSQGAESRDSPSSPSHHLLCTSAEKHVKNDENQPLTCSDEWT